VCRALLAKGLVAKVGDGYRLASDHRDSDASPMNTSRGTDADGAQSLIDKPHSPDTSRAVKTGIRAYSAATGGMVDVWRVDGRLRKG
jgi:hypothetical protein